MHVFFGRQRDQPWQLARHGNDHNPFGGLPIWFVQQQQRRHVQLQIRKNRPRGQLVDRQRRQDRLNLTGKIHLQEMALLVGPLRPPPDVQPMLGQAGKHPANPGVLLVNHPVGAAADGRKLFGGSHARGVAPSHVGRPAPHQPGHPNKKKLVQIRADDRQKLHPLQKRQLLVKPFLQYPVVELQPAQLTVDV